MNVGEFDAWKLCDDGFAPDESVVESAVDPGVDAKEWRR
jgi:hypothetical protein